MSNFETDTRKNFPEDYSKLKTLTNVDWKVAYEYLFKYGKAGLSQYLFEHPGNDVEKMLLNELRLIPEIDLYRLFSRIMYEYPSLHPKALSYMITEIISLTDNLNTKILLELHYQNVFRDNLNQLYNLLQQLIRVAINIDDLDNLEKLTEIAKKKISEGKSTLLLPHLTLHIKSEKAIDIIDPIVLDHKPLLEAAIKICGLKCFKKYYEKGYSNDVLSLLIYAAEINYDIFKYLIETQKIDPAGDDNNFLLIASEFGQDKTVAYLLTFSTVQDLLAKGIGVKALNEACNNLFDVLSNELLEGKLRVVSILLKHKAFSTYDEGIFFSLYPYNKGADANRIIFNIVKLLIQLPSLKLTSRSVIYAVEGDNIEAFSLLLLDPIINIESVIPLIDKEKYKTLAYDLLEDKTNMKWSLKRVDLLLDLTQPQKLKLLKQLELESKLDNATIELINNDQFVKAYVSSNRELASTLNDLRVPLIENVNHGAASVLAVNDIGTYNGMVPISSRL